MPTSFSTSRLPAAGRARTLPDFADFFADHRVALLATESASEFRHIRERPVAAEARQWVWVGVGHQPREFQAFVGAPNLCPAEEELLLGSESISIRRACL